jgi:hypothetical protein
MTKPAGKRGVASVLVRLKHLKAKKAAKVEHPNSKVTKAQWLTAKARMCAGESVPVLAKELGVTSLTVRRKAASEGWVTPRRLAVAVKKRVAEAIQCEVLHPPKDELEAHADLWIERKRNTREFIYANSNKALQRFFAMAPVPQTFQEAAIAEKMLNGAISPESAGGQNSVNVNLAVLTSDGFVPRRVSNG